MGNQVYLSLEVAKKKGKGFVLQNKEYQKIYLHPDYCYRSMAQWTRAGQELRIIKKQLFNMIMYKPQVKIYFDFVVKT